MSNAVIPVAERESFRFDEAFFDNYRDKEPKWTVEGYLTYLRTYSATITDEVTGKQRNEKWWETCRRVVEGTMSIAMWHLRKSSPDLDGVMPTLHYWAGNMYHSLFYQKWAPAGRGLQHMGRVDVIWEKGAAVLNNCAFISTGDIDQDFSAPFEYLMDMSMLGVGTGFDVEGTGKVNLQEPRIDPKWTFVVEDTREGWIELLRIVLLSFVSAGYFPGRIDYSKIRPLGTPLRTMGGLASGPEPLKLMVDELLQVVSVTNRCIGWSEYEPEVRHYFPNTRMWNIKDGEPWFGGGPITANQIGDFANIIGKCVISGGIRRTAEIGLAPITERAFFDRKLDDTLLKAWRAFSNNSVITDTPLSREECQWIGEHAATYGDPGIFFRGNARAWGRTNQRALYDWVVGCNPCGEQALLNGEMCNVPETVPWRHDTTADYMNTMRCAFMYGKIVSLLPTHRAEVNRVQEKNRRIGVSATGVFMAYEKFGRENYLQNYAARGSEEVEYFDREVSQFFGVCYSVRHTTVKPSGSISLVLGVTSGIRAPEGPFSFRLIQFEQTSPLLPVLAAAGYRIEKSVYTPSSHVVYFPVKVDCKRGVDDVSAAEQIQMVVDMQEHWSDNMVSNTIEYQPDEIPLLGELIFQAQSKIKSLALMARVHGFEQAPFQRITEQEYEEYVRGISPIDFSSLHDKVVHEIDEKGCDSGSCSLVPSQE
jgi:ribonucleoside-triphosphate reductase